MYEIKSLNDQGLGVCFVDNKITFVYNTLIGDKVDIKIIKSNSKYNLAIVTKYIKRSDLYQEAKCPYFDKCGGCSFLNMSIEDTLTYKRDKVEHILKKFANIEKKLAIASSEDRYNYRNKITLQVQNKQIGYYSYNTNEIIEIDNCLLVKESINKIIPLLKEFNVINGKIIIRTNYIDEILIYIISDDNINMIKDIPTNVKGIILNNKVLYGVDYLIDTIGDNQFKISYDSFFQVNNYTANIIYDLIKNNVPDNAKVLDLYCGVGTLGTAASSKASKITGIEVVENAIDNANYNATLNKLNNYEYICGKVEDYIDKFIKEKFDVVIVDPPRKGLDKKTIDSLIKINSPLIIYVSCNPITLARDLKILKEYYNIDYTIPIDMFPNTYHIETVCFLERK